MRIGNNYMENGIENLRNFLQIMFFVPNYGTNNGFSEEKIAEIETLISKNLNFKQSNLIKKIIIRLLSGSF